jgi:hypothetical protein
MNCVNETCGWIKFCVKCGEVKVRDFVEQTRGIGQGCSLIPYLFNIVIFIFADYKAFTSNCLRKTVDQLQNTTEA